MTIEAKNERLVIDGTSWRDRWLVDTIAISVAESEAQGTLGSLHEHGDDSDTIDLDAEPATEAVDMSKAELISSGLRLVRPGIEIDESKPDRVRLELDADEISMVLEVLDEARDIAEEGRVMPLSLWRISRAERKIHEKADQLTAA